MKYIKLKELAEISSGGTPSRKKNEYWNNGNVPWIKISDLKYKYTETCEEYITEDGLKNSSAKIFKKGTILFSIFASIGDVSILDFDASTNQAIAGIEVNKDSIDVEYLYYYLTSLKPVFASKGRGVAQNNINLSMLKEVSVPVPDKFVQKQIVKLLQTINQAIDLRKEQLEKLDLLVKAKFVEMFGDPLLNTKNYALSNFGNKFSLSAGGTPSKKIDEYWVGGNIPWIGSNMCKNEYIYESDNKFITEAGLKHSSAKIFKPNTVLVALVGATIGKVGLLKTSLCTNQNVLGISDIAKNGYTPEFIYVYLQGLYNKFMELGDGKFAMASKKFVSDLPLPVVDLSLQTSFSNFLDNVNISKNKIYKSIKEYSLIQSSLMQKYFIEDNDEGKD